MTANAVIRRLPSEEYPWRWGLRLTSVEPDTFHAVIDELKATVPARRRKWNPDTKEWWLGDLGELLAVRSILRRYDLLVDNQGADAPWEEPQPGISRQAEAYKALWLREGAPPELVKAAHRTLAKLHHPDRGGDLATMQQINQAYELLHSGQALLYASDPAAERYGAIEYDDADA